MFKNLAVFTVGFIGGVYATQNYDVPNIKKKTEKTINTVKDYFK
ncbi:hypothetical protein PPL_07090 [Heterostelium album PN500]|uniref:Uncharacterized protein n=1 Tax=Heterostelium pallidum (strain ATCC 26659 / Pp 5 / PN500) TaxID=670386 RepID=D3BED3_HETP5|nr:hypothetical protein PPL_07090 [Heterostelium album PN500]EFA80264.1 hypothetical protein PPL_07090 [Heterostelium album PN500]|eukprot:XP_020432384.1 hypothetical protein PPL_07090 [Heterostelium album PN500]